MSNSAAHLLGLLRSARLPVNTEQELQRAVASVLERNGVRFRREAQVTGGKIDFIAGKDVGIEIKIMGGKRAVYRQCNGYCRDTRIRELIVLTAINLALPHELHGKPVHVVSIGRAWL